MGWLVVTFKLGLAHPLLPLHNPTTQLEAKFTTGNTVCIDPPALLPVDEDDRLLGAFDYLILRVKRKSSSEEGLAISSVDLKKLNILNDAAKAFWQFFESLRESEFKRDGTVSGYNVAPAEEIQNNALVRTCQVESSYEGSEPRIIPLKSFPGIQITEHAWNYALDRLSTQENSLPHVSFALDAAYFADSDPIRAIIMACAAWETALRYYLANVAAKQDQAYLIASEGRSIPYLERFMKAAKGMELFSKGHGEETDKRYDTYREQIRDLPKRRNELLHEGRAAIPKGAALKTALAVLAAIEWLLP